MRFMIRVALTSLFLFATIAYSQDLPLQGHQLRLSPVHPAADRPCCAYI
jgi:hypothetical protein